MFLRVATIATDTLITHVDVTCLAARNPKIAIRTWMAASGREIRETRAGATLTADLLPQLRQALDLAQEAIDDLAARRPA